jgi:hypothetical protein
MFWFQLFKKDKGRLSCEDTGSEAKDAKNYQEDMPWMGSSFSLKCTHFFLFLICVFSSLQAKNKPKQNNKKKKPQLPE